VYLGRVLENFRALTGAVGGTNVRTIDAARSAEAVERDVWTLLLPMLKERT
jgi:thymidylate kinase